MMGVYPQSSVFRRLQHCHIQWCFVVVYLAQALSTNVHAFAMSIDAEGVRAQFLDFCRAGKTFTGDDDMTCARLAEALKALLRGKCDALLVACRDHAVLCSYGSDATAFLCQAVTDSAALGFHVVRKGKVLHEFLCQRGFLYEFFSERPAAFFHHDEGPVADVAGEENPQLVSGVL